MIGDEPVSVMIGDVLSNVTLVPLVTEDTVVITLPEASAAFMLKVTCPPVSPVTME